MSIATKTVLKTYFETGDTPTQTQFASLIDTLGVGLYDARNYGAVGDGVTDDVVAIQAAIDAAALVTGVAAVYMPAGRYMVSTSVILRNGTTLIGDGSKSTKISPTAGFAPADRDHPILRGDGFVFDSSGSPTRRFYLFGINVDGLGVANVSGCGGSFLQPAACRDFRVDDCPGDYGLAVAGGTQDVHFNNLQISGCTYGLRIRAAQMLYFWGLNIESSTAVNHMLLENCDQAAAPSVAQGGAGNVDVGAHQWAIVFLYEGNLEGDRLGTASAVSTIVTSAKQVNLTGIALGAAGTIGRRVYRTAAGGSTYKLVATISDNTTTIYTDNTADASLGAAKSDSPAANTTIVCWGAHWESDPSDCKVRIKRGDAFLQDGIRMSGGVVPFLKCDTLAGHGTIFQGSFREVYGNGGTLFDDVDRGWSGTDAYTGTISASSTTLTITTSSFTQHDKGKRITIVGAGAAGATHDTWIRSVTSATVCELINAAVTTATAQTVTRYNAWDFRAMSGEYVHEIILAGNKSPLSDLPCPGWLMLGANKASVRVGVDNYTPLLELWPATDRTTGTLNPFRLHKSDGSSGVEMDVNGAITFGLRANQAAAPTLSSSGTIAPTTPVAFVSGTSTISTITAPSPISTVGGQITLIPTGLWATNTAGNIALATTAVVGKAVILTYDPTTVKWYPSY